MAVAGAVAEAVVAAVAEIVFGAVAEAVFEPFIDALKMVVVLSAFINVASVCSVT